MDRERAALRALRLNYALTSDDVWRPSPFHLENLNRGVAETVLAGLAEARESADASPIGVVIQGQRGSGKTHLLGWARQQVQASGGYFFLVSLLDAKTFWESVLLSVLDGLAREGADGRPQLQTAVERLAMLVGMPRMERRALLGQRTLSRETLDTFIMALRQVNRQVAAETQDTARALVLHASDDFAAQAVGEAYLSAIPESEPGERAQWGIRPVEKTPQELVRDLSRLLALTGPSLIAVDQLDTLVAQSALSTDPAGELDWRYKLTVEQVAGGLMTLREVTRRTLTVVSCLPATWAVIKSVATDTVQDRFRETFTLTSLPDPETGRALVEKRLTAQYQDIGFTPPYPTWPVKPSAFEDAPDFTPRQLLITVDRHIRSCLETGRITELERLTDEHADHYTAPPAVSDERLAALDTRFAELRAAAPDAAAALDPATEDAVLPRLLADGLRAWIIEQGAAGREFTVDPPPSAKAPLHARLRRILDEQNEDELHWSFRGIAATHHSAALTRLRNAAVAAGLSPDVPKRRLFILRNRGWAKGQRTQDALAALERAHGKVLPLELEDLKIMSALSQLLAANPPHLEAWLVARKPTSQIKIFAEALRDALTSPEVPVTPSGTSEWEAQASAAPAAVQQPTTARSGTGALPLDGAAIPPAEPVPGTTTATEPAAGTRMLTEPGTTVPTESMASATVPADPRVEAGPTGLSHAGGLLQDGTAVPVSDPAAGAMASAGFPGANGSAQYGTAVPLAEPVTHTAVPAGTGSIAPTPAAPAAAVGIRPGAPVPATTGGAGAATGDPVIAIGASAIDGRPVTINLSALRRHTAIFAGSGSGKTVLIRRLIEECALRGVSSIVLDPNNDLARLGDPWPEPPPGWGEGDAALAAEYLAHTDVTIWTPGSEKGRPLHFPPLPDFAAVADDPDEFQEAVDTAVAALIPRAKLDGNASKAHLGRAVLREAVIHYARNGGTDLTGLIRLLAALPDGVSIIDGASKIAADISQHLRAAMVSDRLFAGSGEPVDPATLLTPPPGKRARVSVISFVGLESDVQRQTFVNQLQMALFSWIRRHPAGDRPLGGLLVMDEAQTFAPSGAMTPCTQSTLTLASQARKYGLGLIFATQAPRGLHNRISGNAATQFIGLLSSPAQIRAANELAIAKGGRGLADIGRLRPGEFYAAVDGGAFEKARTPFCLSHHPRSPLTKEEVVARAAAGRAA